MHTELVHNADGDGNADSMDGVNSVINSGPSPSGIATSNESESEGITE
jgi:hypothetical protein